MAELVLVDDGNHSFRISVWDDAYDLLTNIRKGEGISLIGCSATRNPKEGGVKVNLWHNNVHVIRGGDRADSLTQMSATSAAEFTTATATFTPKTAPIDVSGEALHSCAAALAEVDPQMHILTDKLFQTNRCLFQAPASEEALTTEKGNLYAKATLHDWSGSVQVEVVEDAVPQLYGLESREEVLAACRDGTVRTQLRMVNVRGVLRQDGNGKLRKFVAQIKVSPDSYIVSGRAMRMSLGLAQPSGAAVVAVPASRVIQSPMHGLAVMADSEMQGEHQLVPAHRVLLLVQGTSKSKVERVGADSDDAFCVSSLNAKCLLGEGQETQVDLKGYCNMETMLEFRINSEAAVVTVSSISWEGDRLVGSVEFVRKVEPHSLGECKHALTVEWKAALTNSGTGALDSYTSPARSEYWEEGEPARKVRRVDSDPKSPMHK